MKLIKELLSSNDVVSSNRAITIITFLFMVVVMSLSLIVSVNVEILSVILEYSFYLFLASISLKSMEKITATFKGKGYENSK